jgi:hypothetical protein
MTCLFGLAPAFAGTPASLEGRYTNPAYSGPAAYEPAWLEIRKEQNGGLELVFNVACGTKTIPRVFKLHETSSITGTLELIDEGSSQCYTGENPRVILIGETLKLITSPKIRTPGFDGSYELKRQ